MLPHLPSAIASFIESSNARDLDGALARFAPDAVVEDEGRTHRGIQEVRAWRAQTQRASTHTIEPTAVRARGERTVVVATLSGDFPGSPVELQFEFTLADGLIRELRIHP
jgi:ketosteroid isomerase-like protein